MPPFLDSKGIGSEDFGPWGVVPENIRYNPRPLELGGKSIVVNGRAERCF